MDTTSEAVLYGLLCDVVERAYQKLPVRQEGEPLHTSDYAREAANRVLDIVADNADAVLSLIAERYPDVDILVTASEELSAEQQSQIMRRGFFKKG